MTLEDRPEKTEKVVESFICGLWRGTDKIKWTEKNQKRGCTKEIAEERSLMKMITKRKDSWFGHILRVKNFQRRIIKAKEMGEEKEEK